MQESKEIGGPARPVQGDGLMARQSVCGQREAWGYPERKTGKSEKVSKTCSPSPIATCINEERYPPLPHHPAALSSFLTCHSHQPPDLRFHSSCTVASTRTPRSTRILLPVTRPLLFLYTLPSVHRLSFPSPARPSIFHALCCRVSPFHLRVSLFYNNKYTDIR